MKNGFYRLFFPLAVIAFFSVSAGASAEEIKSFDVRINNDKTGSMKVEESIVYDFGEEKKHGIFRDIPLWNKTGDFEHLLQIYDISIQDEKEQNYSFTESDEYSFKRISIGDENKTVSGVKTYNIEYRVDNAINESDDADVLNWNAIGDGWQVPIKKASATFYFQPGIAPSNVQCFAGKNENEDKCEINKNFLEYGQLIFKAEGLKAKQGMTIVAELPKPSAQTFTFSGESTPANSVSNASDSESLNERGNIQQKQPSNVKPVTLFQLLAYQFGIPFEVVLVWLLFPFILGVLVYFTKTDWAVRKTESVSNWLAKKREKNKGRSGIFRTTATKPTLWCASFVMTHSEKIKEKHLRTAVRVAAYLYIFGLFLFLIYVVAKVVLMIVIAIAIILIIGFIINNFGDSAFKLKSPPFGGGGNDDNADNPSIPPFLSPGAKTAHTRTDFLGNEYLEDNKGNKVWKKEGITGDYFVDSKGNKICKKEGVISGEYYEDSKGKKMWKKEGILSGEYYEDKNGKKVWKKEGIFGDDSYKKG